MVGDDGSEREATARDQFEDVFGHWKEAYGVLLDYDPEYLVRLSELAGTVRSGGELDPRLWELVCIGIYATGTTLDEEGVRRHIRSALEVGATPAEIMKVFELVSLVGVHSLTEGAECLRGHVTAEIHPDRLAAAKSEFEAARGAGHWTERWENVAAFRPDVLEAYMQLSSYVIREGALERQERELILVGMDVVATHLFTPGINVHARDALRNGASPAEVFEVIALAFDLGVTSLQQGLPVLLEELERREEC